MKLWTHPIFRKPTYSCWGFIKYMSLKLCTDKFNVIWNWNYFKIAINLDSFVLNENRATKKADIKFLVQNDEKDCARYNFSATNPSTLYMCLTLIGCLALTKKALCMVHPILCYILQDAHHIMKTCKQGKKQGTLFSEKFWEIYTDLSYNIISFEKLQNN